MGSLGSSDCEASFLLLADQLWQLPVRYLVFRFDKRCVKELNDMYSAKYSLARAVGAVASEKLMASDNRDCGIEREKIEGGTTRGEAI